MDKLFGFENYSPNTGTKILTPMFVGMLIWEGQKKFAEFFAL